MKNLFILGRSYASLQFFKFLCAGAINTLFGFIVFSLLIFLKLHYSLAVILGMCLGIIFNFKVTGNFVFSSNDNKLIGKFIAVYATTSLMNIAIIKFLLIFHANLYLAGAIGLTIATVTSYILLKNFVFKCKEKAINV